ncbi:MAG TPA: hypothetical protein VL282_00115 [Tepidisphaeraceae bacterium]|jgi:hypothetical protein|nr:hypothetical protein [Tepidisphaeraceae bacterium]
MLKGLLKLFAVILSAGVGYIVGLVIWIAIVTLAMAALCLMIFLGKPGKLNPGEVGKLWVQGIVDRAHPVGVMGAVVFTAIVLVAILSSGGLRRWRILPMGRVPAALLGLLMGSIIGAPLGYFLGGSLASDPRFERIVMQLLTIAWTIAGAIVGAIAGTIASSVAASPAATTDHSSVIESNRSTG